MNTRNFAVLVMASVMTPLTSAVQLEATTSLVTYSGNGLCSYVRHETNGQPWIRPTFL